MPRRARRERPALALVFDGTGYGTDGTLWGGELLRCDLASFERLAHLDPVPLPGGEAAIREPWRVAAVAPRAGGPPRPWERWALVRHALKVNAPLSSGMGRLFDAVAAVLGVRDDVTYEGQAAIELELLAGDARAEPYDWSFGAGSTRCRGARRPRGRPAARRDRGGLPRVRRGRRRRGLRRSRGPRTVVLSGGTFQNLRLLESTRGRLEELGFRVLSHRRVPPNDGGISYGQAAVAASLSADS